MNNAEKRIAGAFKNGKAFIPYIPCGDPDLDTTKKIVLEAAKSGADLIELGIPFSDPTAEGPVIQRASARALASGATTDKILGLVRELRRETDIPLVFMTYSNVVFSYGKERFASSCREVGIDGLILPDLPYEEKEEFSPECKKYGLPLISLVAPTSNERIKRIARDAEGFLYIVSSLGVTGVRDNISSDAGKIAEAARKHTGIPLAVGFGISTPQQARTMAMCADGIIVGSRVVKIIEEHGADSYKAVGEYVKMMKQAANEAGEP